MRLMDAVANADRERLLVWSGVAVFDVEGAGRYPSLRDCPLRYVLDDNVARLCESLLETDARMLDSVNSLLRVQARNYWVD